MDGNETTYSYNTATRNLLSTTAPSGIVTTLNYDSGYGATPNSQTISGGNLSIKTSQEMKDGGNFAYSTTDALGKTSYVYYNIYDPDYTDRYDRILPDPRTAYPYVGEGEISSGAEGYIDPNPANNLLTGQIFAAVDANGNTTLYSYTEDDYLESVTNGQASVEYDYDTAGRLKTITNGDAVYSFDYNAFGATKNISVGGIDISTNNYREGNGKLLSTVFAGTTLNYTYDALNRVSQKSYSGGDTVSYKYDGNGNLVQRSQANGVEWDFVYDNAGTLVGAARDDIYQAKYKYDAAGRLTALMCTADGQNRYTGFAYNKYEQATNVKITGSSAEINEANTFDALGRLTEKRWTKGSDQAFAEYTYKAGTAANSTSTQLDTVEFGSGTTTTAGRQYEYDNAGNIVKELHRKRRIHRECQRCQHRLCRSGRAEYLQRTVYQCRRRGKDP